MNFKKVAQVQDNPSREGEKSSFIEYMLNQESMTQEEALSTCTDLLIGATETVRHAGVFRAQKLLIE